MNRARAEVSGYTRRLEKPLSQAEAALVAVEQQSPVVTDPDDETFNLLKIERDALAEAWNMLKKDLQEQGKDGSSMRTMPETVESVIHEAQNARKSINDRKRLGGGKPKEYYNKFCQKAYQHRTVFEIFPHSNQYTEIFCGSIKTLVKASVNFIQISEGLSLALDEITELADFSKREVDITTNQYTRRGLARLYKEIFLYLKDCTDWFTRKSRSRALRSFNEDFYKCFEDRMKCIRDVSSTIYQETMIGAMQNLQIRLASTEDLEQQRRRQFEREMTEWKTEIQQLKEPIFQQQIMQAFEERFLKILEHESGLRAKYMLENIYQSDQWQRSNARRVQAMPNQMVTMPEDRQVVGESFEPQRELEAPNTDQRSYNRSEIWDSSKRLESFIVGNSVDLMNILQPSPFASTNVAMKLREWLESRVSITLWIRGLPEAHYPTELSALAGSLISAASASKAPILFYFCEPIQNRDIPAGFTMEEIGVVSLTFSLIRQLVSLLEPDITTNVDFDSDRFLSLEKPLDKWKDALVLLEDLFALSPGVLLCVIDGIDALDYGSGQPKCGDMLSLLKRRELLSTKQGLVFKTLFTSAGYSRTLDNKLSIEEVVIDEVLRRPNPGKPGPDQKLIFGESI